MEKVGKRLMEAPIKEDSRHDLPLMLPQEAINAKIPTSHHHHNHNNNNSKNVPGYPLRMTLEMKVVTNRVEELPRMSNTGDNNNNNTTRRKKI